MRSPGDPSTWPLPEQQFKAELDAAGIPEDTIWELVNSRYDYEQTVPITVDWLEHLDERVPVDQEEGWRTALLRNLITKFARGNQQAVDAVIKQFHREPTPARRVQEAATVALTEIATAAQFDQVAELIRHPRFPIWRMFLIDWLGKIKTPEAIALATDLLQDPDPHARYQAVKAIGRQKARGVRDNVAVLLDDPDAEVREEAAKTLAKLPD